MDKFWDMYKKFSNLVVAIAAAYWAIVGLIGYDPIGLIFVNIHLGFLVRLLYIVVGLIGILKLLEIYKPSTFNKLKDNKKPTTKK